MTYYTDGYIDGYQISDYNTCGLPSGSFTGKIIGVIGGRVQVQMDQIGHLLPGTFTIMRSGILVGYCKLRGEVSRSQSSKDFFMRWLGLTPLAPPQIGDLISSL